MANKENKVKLSVSKFLRIVPERLKRIKNAPDDEVRPLRSYKPNALAAILHPNVQHVKVAEVRRLNGDVTLYSLEPDNVAGTQLLAPFQAGQYICVSVTVGGRRYSRPYSLCSSPSEAPRRYEIAVKKTAGGVVSGYIHDTFSVGTSLDVSAPDGQFTYDPNRDAKDVIALAGGVGITPVRSMIKDLQNSGDDRTITLLYGCRRPGDALFRDEFDAIDDPRIRIAYVYSEEAPEGCEKGFITAELIKKYARSDVYSVFVCGPQNMYRAIGSETAKLGLRRKFVREDAYGQITEPQKEPDYVPADRREYSLTVIAYDKTVSITVPCDVSLLSSMERAGIYAPSKCRSGECGFCHSRLVSGVCYTPEKCDRRRAADKTYGYIHPCCAFPRSDVVIEVGCKIGYG